MKAEFKSIKVRKEQKCEHCGRVILKGEDAEVFKTRTPKYKDEVQVGIEYVKIYLHPDKMINSCIEWANTTPERV